MDKLTEKQDYYKAIMLVISSYDNIYSDIVETWKTYMKKVNNVKIYLLYCRSDLDEQMVVDENEGIIMYNCEESLVPGIYLKSIHSMDYCHKTFKYDYLIRTNLSSFYNIPKLLDYLDELPDNNYAGGVYGVSYNIPFICGAGIVISSDLIEKMLKSALQDNAVNEILHYPDDVLLSYLINLHINPVTYQGVPRCNISEKLTVEKIESLSRDYFHFRNRNDQTNRVLDSQNIALLAKYFYDT